MKVNRLDVHDDVYTLQASWSVYKCFIWFGLLSCPTSELSHVL